VDLEVVRDLVVQKVMMALKVQTDLQVTQVLEEIQVTEDRAVLVVLEVVEATEVQAEIIFLTIVGQHCILDLLQQAHNYVQFPLQVVQATQAIITIVLMVISQKVAQEELVVMTAVLH
jgi:hypothetical protein